MRRRSRASSKLAKARSRKAKTLKAARRSSSSVAGRETEVGRFHRERDEALEREAATSEVLRLISSSPGDLELVIRTILEHATRICNANFGNLFRFDGENFLCTFWLVVSLVDTHQLALALPLAQSRSTAARFQTTTQACRGR
jgi:hypothetical protein